MQEQHLNNYTRLHPVFHFFLAPLSLLASVFSFLWLIGGFEATKVLLGIAFFLIHLTAFLAKDYAKKNQDRIIRSEIRLRYYILTGKDFTALEEKLSMAQIVALRFANDQDFLDLMKRQDLPQLSSRQIKEELRAWRADYARV